MPPETPKLALNAREAATALGISERTLWALTREGIIPAVRLGGRVVYPVAVLQRWLEAQAGAGNPAAEVAESGRDGPVPTERGR